MESRVIIEEVFYRIYDKNGTMSCTPQDEEEVKMWFEKGKAPFLVWRNDTWYETTKRVWRKIAKAEKVVRKVVEEIEPMDI